MSDPAETADVIGGGGSAGAVLAARLSQNSMIADPDHDWGSISRGNDQTPRIPTPRDKVLGGNSAVNAGAAGWSFDDVPSAFKLLENTPAGDDAYHELTPSLRGFVEAASTVTNLTVIMLVERIYQRSYAG